MYILYIATNENPIVYPHIELKITPNDLPICMCSIQLNAPRHAPIDIRDALHQLSGYIIRT